MLLAIVALCLGVLAALIIGEGMLRMIGVQSTLVYRPDPNYGWGHTPGNSFEWQTEGQTQHITINSSGLRDYDYPYIKPAHTHRTLVLGDSFAEGFQVPLAERFSNLIADELNAGRPDSTLTYEVINAGVSGYGTDNALLFFRHEGYKYQPDLVILALYVGNDVRNNWYPLENIDTGGFRKPYFEWVDGQLEAQQYPFLQHTALSTQLKIFLNKHLVMYSFLRQVRDQIRHSGVEGTQSGSGGIPLDYQLYEADPGRDWVQAFEVTDALLGNLQAEVNAHGAQLLVVLIPSRVQVHDAQWQTEIQAQPELQEYQWDLNKPNKMLGESLSGHGIDYLDLLPLLRAAAESGNTDLYIIGDGHWNATGHREAARLIYSELNRITLMRHRNEPH
jgi:hypothetical protein